MKNEVNDLYDYGYKIVQNKEYFKFSLDSILLADFVKINPTDKILLDFCTGNAPLPIILSSKIKNIVAIEIQKEIYNLAKESIEINNIHNITLINDDVKNVKKYYSDHKVDIITCNPPYFKYKNDSIINDNMIKSIARHEITITLEDIIKLSSSLLKSKGRLYLVHRPERLVELTNLLQKYHFGIKTLQFVYSDDKCPCSMVLVETMLDGKNSSIILEPLFSKNYRR